MNLIRHCRRPLLAASVLALTACSSGSREDGLRVSIDALALATPEHLHGELPAAGPRTFRRVDGMKIELETGLLRLVPVELSGCAHVAAAWASRLNPLGSARAHGGGSVDAPAGAQSVLAAPGSLSEVGSLAVSPGEYCGLVLELQPGADGASALLHAGPCYYPATVGLSDAAAAAEDAHECLDLKLGGSSRRFTVPFSQPLRLDAARRERALTLGIRYEEWFDGLDMAALAAGDAAARSRLLDNVQASLLLASDAEQLLSLAFDTEVGGAEAVCGQTYEGLGSGEQRDYQLGDFRFYLSDLALVQGAASRRLRLAPRLDGLVYEGADHGAALLGQVAGCSATLADRREVKVLHGVADAGPAQQLCFNLGLPFALNHLDVAAAPSPMNNTAMHWAWLSGRKFLRVDGKGDPDGAAVNFFLHLGSTGCSNGSGSATTPPEGACGQPNLPRICLDYAAIASGHAIKVDVAPVFAGVDLGTNTPGTAPGCMSGTTDPECETVMPRLGIDYLYNGSVIPAEPQALFRVAH